MSRSRLKVGDNSQTPVAFLFMATETRTQNHTLYFCYIDESGVSSIPGNSSHFVLAGLSIPIYKWKTAENDIDFIKQKYGLTGKEIHTGWLLRTYQEQNKIPHFESLNHDQRRAEIVRVRLSILYELQKSKKEAKQFAQIKKNFKQTEDYTHLTFQERRDFIYEIANKIGNWGFARVFAECVDKAYFQSKETSLSLDEHSFEQIVTRFEFFLTNKGNNATKNKTQTAQKNIKNYGILIHDNNATVEQKHTQMMKQFHRKGTSWTKVDNIIETPLFVDSSLTSMIQLTDVCAYAIRRYVENGEIRLFDEIYKRADTKGSAKVGIRHFSASSCTCAICIGHVHVPVGLSSISQPASDIEARE